MPTTADIAIIGAGISGLSLAHQFARMGFATLVLERSHRSGGACHSYHASIGENAFWLELGAHTCYNSYVELVDLIEQCDLLACLQPRQKLPFKLLVDGQLVSIPSQLRLIELLLCLPRFFITGKSGKTVSSYYSRILGHHNFQRVISAVFSAIPSQCIDDFPADIIFKRRRRRKDVIRNFSLWGGLQTLVDALGATPGVEIVCGAEVNQITRKDESFEISTAGTEVIHCKALSLAISPSEAAGLLQPAYPTLARKLHGIDSNVVESMGVVVRKSAVHFPSTAGIIPLDDCFFSMVSRDPIPHSTYRGFTFHFKPGLLGHNEKIKRAGTILGVVPEHIDHVVETIHSLPTFALDHKERVAAITDALDGIPVALTGNYFGGLAIEDCVHRSRIEAERLQLLLS